MNRKFYTLKRDQIEITRPLVEARLKESHLEGTTADHCILTMQRLYDIRCGGVYVDDVANPTLLVALSFFPDTFVARTICYLNLIYTKPEHRGDLSAFSDMLELAENFARMNNCDALQGVSWVKDGHKDIGVLYERHGFKKESVAYIKQL